MLVDEEIFVCKCFRFPNPLPMVLFLSYSVRLHPAHPFRTSADGCARKRSTIFSPADATNHFAGQNDIDSTTQRLLLDSASFITLSCTAPHEGLTP